MCLDILPALKRTPALKSLCTVACTCETVKDKSVCKEEEGAVPHLHCTAAVVPPCVKGCGFERRFVSVRRARVLIGCLFFFLCGCSIG